MPPPDFSHLLNGDEDDYSGDAEARLIESLFNDGLPASRKEKKQKEDNVDMKETEGGAEICMPKMRKRKPQLPKGFDPAHPPSTLPDPERWLPKWQRSKYKKYARKKAKYMKGGAVQGDS